MSKSESIRKRLATVRERLDKFAKTIKRAEECVHKGDVPRAHALIQFRIYEELEPFGKTVEKSLDSFGNFFRNSANIEEAEAETPDTTETVPRAPAEQGREAVSSTEPPQSTFLPLFALRYKNGTPIGDTVLCGNCKTKESERHTRQHALKHHQGEWDRGPFTEANGEGMNCSVCGRDNKQGLLKGAS